VRRSHCALGRINRCAAAPARASRGSWLLLLPAACAGRTGRAGAARTGEGGMSGIKNSTPAQRVTAPRGAGTGCPPAQRRVNPRSNQSAFLPLAGRPARLRLVRRLPALIDAARGSAQPCCAPVPDALCVRGSSVLSFFASVSQSRRSAHSAPVVKLAVATGMENFRWT